MLEQHLTQAELEGERELARLIESGELAQATPASAQSGDETDHTVDDTQSTQDKLQAEADKASADDSAPVAAIETQTTEETQPEAAADASIEAIEYDLQVQQSALLEATQARLAMEARQQELAEQFSGINPALDELADRLDDGELTQGQYDKQKRALEDQRTALQREYEANHAKISEVNLTEVQASAKIQELEAAKNPLNILVNEFLSQPANAIYNDPAAGHALGSLFSTLKDLPKMAGKTDAELLTLADRQYRMLNDITDAPAPAPKAQPKETAEQKAARLAKTIPTGISSMPAVTGNSSANPYADLASKSGPEIEAAFAKMTPDQQEEFLSNMK